MTADDNDAQQGTNSTPPICPILWAWRGEGSTFISKLEAEG